MTTPLTIQAVTKRIYKKTSRFRILFTLFMLPSLVLLVSGLVVWLMNQQIKENGITRKTNAFWYWFNEPVLVSLYPTVKNTKEKPGLKADVLFALDVSGSMGNQKRSGDALFESLKAIRLLSQMLISSGVNVGFLEFDSEARLTAPLGADLVTLNNAWQQINAGGGTNIAKAITKSLSHINEAAKSEQKKLIVVVSDGGDSIAETKKLAEQAQQNNITLAGIGIGGANKNYFDQAYPSPHYSTCCDNDDESLMHFLGQILTQSDILEYTGENVRLIEYPHFSALPLMTSTDLTESRGIPYTFHRQNQLDFIMYYYLDSPHFYSYALKAEALGVHPIVKKPAELTYTDKSGKTISLQSGSAIHILVISPWLLVWLYLPALLYVLMMLLTRRPQLDLMDPKDLPILSRPSMLADLVRQHFKKHSLLPITTDESEIIPSLLIAIGPKAGEILAALMHNRTEVGLAHQSESFLPIYLDCRQLSEDDYPSYMDIKLDKSMTYRFSNQQNSLTQLIQEINTTPHKHPVAHWFNSALYQGKVADLKHGCDGDRMLARLALYHDLCANQPELHQFQAKVKKWCQVNTTGQIFVIASGYEDLGSGWLIDIGFHIRRAIHQQTLPCYAIIDTEQQGAYSQNENYPALKTELKICQAGAGWPYHSMERIDNQVSDSQSVILPLFDRIITFEHDYRPANAGLIGAALLELCDAKVKSTITACLAKTAGKNRMATKRDDNTFLTLIDLSVLSLPIAVWRKRWSLWGVRDILKVLIAHQVKDKKTHLENHTKCEYIVEIWKEMQSIKITPPFQTLPYWDVLCYIGHKIPPLLDEKTIYQRELILLIVNYLNASVANEKIMDLIDLKAHRFYRFKCTQTLLMTWINQLNKLKDNNKMYYDALFPALEHASKKLQAWSEALLIAPDNQPKGILQQLVQQLKSLDIKDPTAMKEGGRVVVESAHWKYDLASTYKKEIPEKLIKTGELPYRFQWVSSADGYQLELNLLGITTQRYNLQNIQKGLLQKDMQTLLENYFVPQMLRWSLDECFEANQLTKHLAQLKIKNIANTFIFHGFQEQAEAVKKSEIEAMDDPEIVRHSYRDRIVLFSLEENVDAEVVDETEYQADLPYTQSGIVILRNLLREKDGNNIVMTSITKLITQQHQYLEIALIALLSKNLIIPDKRNPFEQCFLQTSSGKLPLTLLGDKSAKNAIMQLLFRKVDINGKSLDTDALLAQWSADDKDKRNRLVSDYIQHCEKQATWQDWQYLLYLKAVIDLKNKGGILQ